MTPTQRRVGGLSLLAFLMMASYAVARPAAESLFLEAHGSEALPWAWVGVALLATAAVSAYNRLVPGRELIWLFGGAGVASGALLAALLLAERAGVPGVYYALYAWKDVYVIVLLESFYAFADAVFPIRTARWVYGWLGMVAAAGGVVGNLSVGRLARAWGTAETLWLVLPLLGLMVAIAWALSRSAGRSAPPLVDERPGLLAGMQVVRSSRYLGLMLALVVAAQITITLVDLQFNQAMELAYPEQDVRTGVFGQVYAAIDTGSLILHALSGVILRLTGAPLILLAVPLLLGASVGLHAAVPIFAAAAFAKWSSKAFDYSIHRTARELLYIPLGMRQKTEGKAVVDILGYRVAKGLAAALLLALSTLGSFDQVGAVTLAVISVWLALAALIGRRFRGLVSRDEELRRPPAGDAP
ncbi:MAG: hypothetical protein JXX28_00410 [Deltaproteobacteria bacterium]|nr:hypothetical protein [Deltaproteobacteria bacterium]